MEHVEERTGLVETAEVRQLLRAIDECAVQFAERPACSGGVGTAVVVVDGLHERDEEPVPLVRARIDERRRRTHRGAGARQPRDHPQLEREPVSPAQPRQRSRNARYHRRRVQADEDVRQISKDDGLVDPESQLARDRDGRLDRAAQPVNGLKFAFDVICQRVPFHV